MRYTNKRHYRLSPRILSARAHARIYYYGVPAVVSLVCAVFVFAAVFSTAAFSFSPPASFESLSLSNYPNPFDSRVTATRIIITSAGRRAEFPVSVTIYDLLGFPVRTYGRVESANIVWDGRDDAGSRVSKGGYVCVVTMPDGRIAALRKIGVIH